MAATVGLILATVVLALYTKHRRDIDRRRERLEVLEAEFAHASHRAKIAETILGLSLDGKDVADRIKIGTTGPSDEEYFGPVGEIDPLIEYDSDPMKQEISKKDVGELLRVRAHVKDPGPGVDREGLAHTFETAWAPFYRGVQIEYPVWRQEVTLRAADLRRAHREDLDEIQGKLQTRRARKQ